MAVCKITRYVRCLVTRPPKNLPILNADVFNRLHTQGVLICYDHTTRHINDFTHSYLQVECE